MTSWSSQMFCCCCFFPLGFHTKHVLPETEHLEFVLWQSQNFWFFFFFSFLVTCVCRELHSCKAHYQLTTFHVVRWWFADFKELFLSWWRYWVSNYLKSNFNIWKNHNSSTTQWIFAIYISTPYKFHTECDLIWPWHPVQTGGWKIQKFISH